MSQKLLTDAYGRRVRYIRVSVIEACNLRCRYCLPAWGEPTYSKEKERSSASSLRQEPHYQPIVLHPDTHLEKKPSSPSSISEDSTSSSPSKNLLTDKEVVQVLTALAEIGVEKVRVTGGEPLLRPNLPDLIRRIVQIPGITSVTMTTNGLLLARYAKALKEAGLHRVNISLDTLNRERFLQMARRDALDQVLEGITAAEQVGLTPIKINCVVVRGINEQDVPDLARKTFDHPWHIRFLEIMPIGQARTLWPQGFVSMEEMLEWLSAVGPLEPITTETEEIAKLYRFPGAKGIIGFITPMSHHFCSTCDRLRLTADGHLRPCLCDASEIALLPLLRSGATKEEIQRAAWDAMSLKPWSGVENQVLSGFRTMAQIGG